MSISPEFIDKIFSIPYVLGGRNESGIDCWGLVVICYKELFDIDIPTYDETALELSNGDITAKDIKEYIKTSAPVVEVDSPQYGDMILVNFLGNPVHIGFMLDEKTMLHTSEKTGVASADIRGVKWNKKIKGYYRHKTMIQ